MNKNQLIFLSGIAFPCCVSVNNCICHFSPLTSEPDTLLKDGDMVKLDLGAHIDGFIAVVAHTEVVGASKDNKVSLVTFDHSTLLYGVRENDMVQTLIYMFPPFW